MTVIGQSMPRIDATSKVLGTAPYPGDLDRPGQLWMKILFAGGVLVWEGIPCVTPHNQIKTRSRNRPLARQTA